MADLRFKAQCECGEHLESTVYEPHPFEIIFIVDKCKNCKEENYEAGKEAAFVKMGETLVSLKGRLRDIDKVLVDMDEIIEETE